MVFGGAAGGTGGPGSPAGRGGVATWFVGKSHSGLFRQSETNGFGGLFQILTTPGCDCCGGGVGSGKNLFIYTTPRLYGGLRQPRKVLHRPGGVGFSTSSVKNPSRIFGIGAAGCGRCVTCRKIPLRTFWAKRNKWIWRTFSNFDNPGLRLLWRRSWIL